MKITTSQKNIVSEKTELAIFFIPAIDKKNIIENLASSFAHPLSSILHDFKAEKEETIILYVSSNIQRIAFVGLGDCNSLDILRRSALSISSKIKPMKIAKVSLDLSNVDSIAKSLHEPSAFVSQTIVEYFMNGQYDYDGLKTAAPKEKIKEIVLYTNNAMRSKISEIIKYAEIITAAEVNVRNLVNSPSNHLSAVDLSNYIMKSGKQHGYKVTVFNKAKITALKMGGLLGVNQGSTNPPTFNIMEYKPAKAKLKIAIVGKGVTFDTGGISIKPSTNMGDMKADMAGAAAVVGTMEAVSKLKLPIHLYGIIPATDNKPSGSAQNPGDVIKTYAGLTVEVDNTDAEGRLILADALTYAKKTYKPDVIIDLATLTGACIIALGKVAAGLFSNNDELAEKLYQAGLHSGEKVWRMPIWSDYDSIIKSKIADVKNTGDGSGGGSIAGAKFLEKFIDNHTAWAHIDIAGTAMSGGVGNYSPNSFPSFGVKLLVEYMKGL